MTLSVYTARISYSGPDRLDVSRKSAGPDGLPFAPSWQILRPMLAVRRAGGDELAAWSRYVVDYTTEMRTSYRERRPAWNRLLARDEVTLCCYCTDPTHCHRTLLAGLFAKLGAASLGERT
jgi:hypothetical protein